MTRNCRTSQSLHPLSSFTAVVPLSLLCFRRDHFTCEHNKWVPTEASCDVAEENYAEEITVDWNLGDTLHSLLPGAAIDACVSLCPDCVCVWAIHNTQSLISIAAIARSTLVGQQRQWCLCRRMRYVCGSMIGVQLSRKLSPVKIPPTG